MAALGASHCESGGDDPREPRVNNAGIPAPHEPELGAVVFIDDDEADRLVARHCYAASRLKNPWVGLRCRSELLDYLAKAKRGIVPPPAAVLVDVNLPGDSGFDIVRTVKADHGLGCDVPFVIISTSSVPGDADMAIEVGAMRFFCKVGTLEEFANLFNELPV
jgi:CheY-like chemotaxis protein